MGSDYCNEVDCSDTEALITVKYSKLKERTLNDPTSKIAALKVGSDTYADSIVYDTVFAQDGVFAGHVQMYYRKADFP